MIIFGDEKYIEATPVKMHLNVVDAELGNLKEAVLALVGNVDPIEGFQSLYQAMDAINEIESFLDEIHRLADEEPN